ncbi:hypothetical protein GOP47_0019003 [Adiantum capillus-veneris]|uniref:DNA polymerase epsilon catalytic subunit n=1 Tax=Adiantum capillus-veneris TaxID=13818 RepID=A0A9D4UE98_ADICA|nr:hypothetical protein GOP47_0019003 [Adiantum capillus-veneris]
MSERGRGSRGGRGFFRPGSDGTVGRGRGKGSRQEPTSNATIGNDSVRRVGRSRVRQRNAQDALESRLGFDAFSEGEPRLGWLVTLSPSSLDDPETSQTYSCVDLYFMCQDGSTFKSQFKFAPYFYLATKRGLELEVEAYLRRRYEGAIANIQIVEKEDLDLKNHLSGLQGTFLKVSFDTVQNLTQVKSDLMPVVERNQAKLEAAEAYESFLYSTSDHKNNQTKAQDYLDFLIDIREYDVPYHVRFAIDNDVRCGQWYTVEVESSNIKLERRSDLLQRAEVRVCAFDIETTKLPLKFPDASYDMVMMISYMIDGEGYLIVNRECVGQDIDNLEYTPKPEFEGQFKVTNVTNEKELLLGWFSHMQEVKPGIYVTYNGDFFDWPFLEARAKHHGMKMSEEIGFRCDPIQGECRGKFACHLDCFAWVKRDSYLPQGSQGLKAVTKAKLGYDPLEVNPEDMVRFAMEQPQTMASYSVSDAVATYFLYMTYVHPFIFSLATIIPMPPDEVLRKGSGTLCEMLLMVQAFKANIICPNKHQAESEKFYKGRLLESETYIGGHVECLESGVFRSDLPTRFRLVPEAYQQLIDNLDRDLRYAIEVEGKMDFNSVINYDDVKQDIKRQLQALHDLPNREECPLIYHLDVAAMYPNIILTNRLQPPSIVSDDVCAACDFNRPGKACLRHLEWVWRGESYMAKRSEYYHLKNQIESEQFTSADGQAAQYFRDLPKEEQQTKLKERLKKYCQKVYKRVLDKPTAERRVAGICMRENPFYVDTVRSFRDRRYEYKGLNKVWKGKLGDAKASENLVKIQEAKDMVVLYDSLQLAHKCILNSFYGYVMRKGARWYSMEMAGVVTYTGAKIIQNARVLVDQIGKPLELDTDGIWCALPGSFPENFVFKSSDPKKKLTISYPCVMLNVDVALNNTNDQYQTLTDPVQRTYTTRSECSIEFEVDGPYKAMILPASKAEGVQIKKRYAVFNHDGTLAELKGFEVKRRGELKLIKVFQAEVFEKFLCGETLEQCYDAVASVANRWLDLLENHGVDIVDSELLDYISESSTMSKSLAEYGEQKSCAVTTAKRLADFLGSDMVKDKGLSCRYIVAKDPQGAPVSERAIPVAIFETEPEVTKAFLRKWCKVPSDATIRSIVDWEYYRQRLGSAIQKIISIPAAMQKVTNPVPRVSHPDWLWKKIREKNDKYRQRNISDMLSAKLKTKDSLLSSGSETGKMGGKKDAHLRTDVDMEDFGSNKENIPSAGLRTVIKTFQSSKACVNESTRQGLRLIPANLSHDSRQKAGILTDSQHQNGAEDKVEEKCEDYEQWLEQKKRKWREMRERRKRQRQDGFAENVSARLERSKAFTVERPLRGTKNQTGVGAYFRNREAALLHSHWQILQMTTGQEPGEFVAWVMAGGDMFKIPIKVPRQFFINTRASLAEGHPGRRVSRILPHARPSFNLIEVVVEERQFKAAGRKLAAHLADPEVEGVYETKMPLTFHAVMQLGCVCSVDKKASQQGLQDSWSLEDLVMKTTTECPYISEALSFLYLYHSASDVRGLYALYTPSSSTISIVVVNPFNNKEVSIAQLEKQFRDAAQTSSTSNGLESLDLVFKVDYVSNSTEAGRQIQRTLAAYRERYRGPTLAVIECPSKEQTIKSIPILAELPSIEVACNARDSQFPALGWQPSASKIAIQRCFASSSWLQERMRLSNYAHVPLGNFDSDWILSTADSFYARALRDHQQVLWVSEDGVPDLGGIPEEEPSFADEVQQPSLIFAGAYRSIVIELKVLHLAVNALLKCNQINEMEGGALLGFELDAKSSGESATWDESSSCATAFRVLKQMVQGWVADAVNSGNVFADALLQHLYRWLCSPHSKLHDPALHRVLHKVMQKVFALLLAELRKLGATIVFADFSRIIIATGKTNVQGAQGYCEYLVKTLQTRDLFEWIELDPQRYWHSLLFMDQYNYGGIQVKDLQLQDTNCGERMSQSNSSQNDLEVSQPDIISSWNIAEYLPKVTQDYFIVIVSEFLYIPWKHAQEQAKFRAAAKAVASTSCTPSVTVAAAANAELAESTFLKDQIASYFTDKLLRIVRDVLRHMSAKQRDDSDMEAGLARDFPKLAGSHLHMGDPALEFIKHVHAVFSLDQRVQYEALVMKRNLLKLVRVKEFSPEAQFHDPCLSFTLPNVICSYCNDCRDLDICRDAALLERDWRCSVPQCGQPYDKEWIENALIQVVRQRERLYHLQDLICSKCRQVKASHLSEQCACAGAFKCSETFASFQERMRVFLNIAIYHEFELLQEFVAWILEAH